MSIDQYLIISQTVMMQQYSSDLPLCELFVHQSSKITLQVDNSFIPKQQLNQNKYFYWVRAQIYRSTKDSRQSLCLVLSFQINKICKTVETYKCSWAFWHKNTVKVNLENALFLFIVCSQIVFFLLLLLRLLRLVFHILVINFFRWILGKEIHEHIDWNKTEKYFI